MRLEQPVADVGHHRPDVLGGLHRVIEDGPGGERRDAGLRQALVDVLAHLRLVPQLAPAARLVEAGARNGLQREVADGARVGDIARGAPADVDFAPPRKVYTNIDTEAFWERFTQAELVAYDVAMQHDPAAGNPAKKAAAKLRIFRRDASDAGYRNLTKPKVRTFVQELEAASDTMGGTILAVGRATVILDTPITVDEAYGQHTP